MIRALPNHIICRNGDFGNQVSQGGIIVRSSIGKAHGIGPRWFQVHCVGENIHWLTPGEWVLVDNGRWTQGFEYQNERYWRVDPEGCLMTADEKPATVNSE